MMGRVIQAWCACAIAVFLVGTALAEPSDVVLSVRVTSGSATGVLEITADQGTWSGGDFSWSTDKPIAITSGTEVLGTFGPGNIEVRAGTAVSIGYSMQAGNALTDFTFNSPLLTLHDIGPVLARGSGAFTLQDFSGDGAAYDARLGCYLADGTVCWEDVAHLAVHPPDLLAVGSLEHPEGGGWEAIPAGSGLRMGISGTLSPYSFGTGSAFFEIIPEPATALLMLLSLGLIRRR